jgi:hypothetical protein
MDGELMTGPVVTSFSVGHGTNNVDLISNPYPSALDFMAFQATNSTVVGNTYYIWDPLLGSYSTYTIGSGGLLTKDVQVGQGIFIQTLSSAPVNFANSMRLHSTAAFVKDMYANQLRLDASGNGFGDAAFVYFKEGASAEYDIVNDAVKWASMFEDATQISTVSADMVDLTMNSIPPLGNSTVSVPLNFKCGAEGTYTITASQIESFENGTDIYLEDIQTGAAWVRLNDNPVYTFTATATDPKARFILHFFGPTGINEARAPEAIRIYSYNHDAYILNDGTEVIKKYEVYDMMGRLLQSGSELNSTVNKVYVGQEPAYYVVKVITQNRIYTGKVFIK